LSRADPRTDREMAKPARDFFRYLPPSDRAMQWGLYVRGAGFQSIEPHGRFPPSEHPQGYMFSWPHGRTLDEYQTLYITRGKGVFESSVTGVKEVVAGSVLMLFPGVWHRYRPLAAVGWDEYWVSYGGPNVDRLVENGFLSPQDAVLNSGLDNELLQAYRTLLNRLRCQPIGVEQLLAASVVDVLATALNAVRAQTTAGRTHELICRAKALLGTRESPIPTIEAMAASLGMSATHFHRIFRTQTGLSPYQYRLQLRLENARQMLQGTTLSIKEIAATLSFESPFHFSKIFKRKTGFSPTQWRRRSMRR
jgi:AraC-like DNA-binding protein